MERKSMIKVRGGFSDRAGIDPCNIQMQIDDFDERTRTFISNKLYDFLQVTFNHECETRNIKYGPTDQNLSNIFCKNLMQNVFADLNHLPLGYHYDWEKFYSRIEEVLMEAPYNEVLDLLWYICNWFSNGEITASDDAIKKDLCDTLNLNCSERRIPENRKAALTAYLRVFVAKHPTGDIKESCRRELEKYQQESPKMPYVGIILDWLTRHTQ